MKHDILTTTPTQEDDGWGVPADKANFDSGADWDASVDTQSPEEILASVESPKRRGLMKRLGEKVATITGGKTVENMHVDTATGEQAPTEAEHKEAYDALMMAEENLRATKAKLAEREKYLDSQKAVPVLRRDESGISDFRSRQDLEMSQIAYSREINSSNERSAVDRARKALEDAQAKQGDVAQRSWDAPSTAPVATPDSDGWG
ncbi:MAG: hypothetical protein ABJA64_00705 [Candidatus Saccharibacteria bacterium]